MTDKKKVNSKVISSVVFFALIVVTVCVIVSQSGSFSAEGFWNYILDANPVWISAAVVCMFLSIFCEGAALRVICDIMGYRRGIRKGLVYSAADIYFSAITPSATGGQPASAFFMMQDDIPAIVTTTSLLINLALYTLSIVILAALSFILCPSAFLTFRTTGRVFIIIGSAVQVALFAGFLMMVFNEALLMRIIDFIERILNKLHLKRRGDRKARFEKMRADYRASSERLHAHKGKIVVALLLNLLQRLSLLLIPACLLLAEGAPASDAVRGFATQGMIVVGATFIPIPGAIGISDMMFFDGFETLTKNLTCLELLSRSISFYISVLFCGLLVLAAYLIRKKRSKIS